MVQIVELCGYFAIVFAVSIGISYFLTNLRFRKKVSPPFVNSTLQIRSGGGMYRSKFVGVNGSGWVITAPLSRDAYVPLRVGEPIVVLAPTENGLRHFHSEIVLRDSETHELTLKVPDRMSKVERRQTERIDKFFNPNAVVEGQPATLLDLSEGGARLITHDPLRRGDRTSIDIPGTGQVFGWVLDSSPAHPGHVLRVRFEEPVKI